MIVFHIFVFIIYYYIFSHQKNSAKYWFSSSEKLWATTSISWKSLPPHHASASGYFEKARCSSQYNSALKKSTTEKVNQPWEIRGLYFWWNGFSQNVSKFGIFLFCFFITEECYCTVNTFNVIFFSDQITDYFCKRWRLLRPILLISWEFSYLIVFQWFTFRYLFENRFFFSCRWSEQFFYHCRRGHFNVCSLLYIECWCYGIKLFYKIFFITSRCLKSKS